MNLPGINPAVCAGDPMIIFTIRMPFSTKRGSWPEHFISSFKVIMVMPKYFLTFFFLGNHPTVLTSCDLLRNSLA